MIPVVKFKRIVSKGKMFGSIQLYNHFFFKLKGDYFTPIYMLPLVNRALIDELGKKGKFKRYETSIRKKFEVYKSENIRDLISEVHFIKNGSPLDYLEPVHKLILGFGDESVREFLKVFGEGFVEEDPSFFISLAKYGFETHYLNLSEAVHTPFKPQRFDKIVIINLLNGDFRLKTTVNNILNSPKLLQFFSLYPSPTPVNVSGLPDKVLIWTAGGFVWKVDKKPVVDYVVTTVENISLKEIAEKNARLMSLKKTNQLVVLEQSISPIDKRAYLLIPIAKRRLNRQKLNFLYYKYYTGGDLGILNYVDFMVVGVDVDSLTFTEKNYKGKITRDIYLYSDRSRFELLVEHKALFIENIKLWRKLLWDNVYKW